VSTRIPVRVALHATDLLGAVGRSTEGSLYVSVVGGVATLGIAHGATVMPVATLDREAVRTLRDLLTEGSRG